MSTAKKSFKPIRAAGEMKARVGQMVGIREKSHSMPVIVESVKDNARRERLPFVEADEKKLEGRLTGEPQLSDLPIPIQENLIGELYSKV